MECVRGEKHRATGDDDDWHANPQQCHVKRAI